MSGMTFSAFESVCRKAAPEVVIVLGSGLGAVAERMEGIASVSFADIPGLASSSVLGHPSRLIVGRWRGRGVVLAQGRVHYYEGHPWEVVVRPIAIAAGLGVRRAILTSAAGGIRADLGPGALMPVRDHLEWNRPYPWRVPPATSPYSPGVLETILAAARQCGMELTPGVYASVTGPSYETPAEIRALSSAGADAVGMSTTREVLAGVATGLECAAISLITNRAAGLSGAPLSHAEVLTMARQASQRLADLFDALLATGWE